MLVICWLAEPQLVSEEGLRRCVGLVSCLVMTCLIHLLPTLPYFIHSVITLLGAGFTVLSSWLCIFLKFSRFLSFLDYYFVFTVISELRTSHFFYVYGTLFVKGNATINSSTLRIEVACSSETMMSSSKTMQCQNPEEHRMNAHRIKNWNIRIFSFFLINTLSVLSVSETWLYF
jgi:hypothetical protein